LKSRVRREGEERERGPRRSCSHLKKNNGGEKEKINQ